VSDFLFAVHTDTVYTLVKAHDRFFYGAEEFGVGLLQGQTDVDVISMLE